MAVWRQDWRTSRWRERKGGEMSRSSLDFQSSCNDKRDLLSSVQECPHQLVWVSLHLVWFKHYRLGLGSMGPWTTQEGISCPACMSVGPLKGSRAGQPASSPHCSGPCWRSVFQNLLLTSWSRVPFLLQMLLPSRGAVGRFGPFWEVP